MSVCDRLKTSMKEANINSAAELARITKLKEVTVRAYVNGTRSPPLEECFILAKPLKKNPFWLFNGKAATELSDAEEPSPSPPQPKFDNIPSNASKPFQHNPITDHIIPLYSAAFAGSDDAIAMEKDRAGSIQGVYSQEGVKEAYAVYVVGDSMEPRYKPGEIVYVHPYKPIKKGACVVAQIAGDNDDGTIECYIKEFVSNNEKTLRLKQYNPEKELRFAKAKVKAVHLIVMAG